MPPPSSQVVRRLRARFGDTLARARPDRHRHLQATEDAMQIEAQRQRHSQAMMEIADRRMIQLDQLVLKVHHEHNALVTPTEPPAKRRRKAQTCKYCGGKALPAHKTSRNCPQRIADEKSGAGSSGPATGV